MQNRSTTIAGLCLCAATALPGCAAWSTHPTSITTATMIREGRAEGLDLEDPIEIDGAMIKEIDDAVGHHGTQEYRLRYLHRYLNDAGYVNFQYLPERSLTARQAFRERKGDCIAYTNLFLALARQIGIPAYFVHVSQVKNYYERAGWLFTSSHVAVGAGHGPTAVIIDFSHEISDWWLSVYETIDDGAALALFYNNVAVQQMVSGQRTEAERLFRFLLAREPGVPELYNNLGVLLNRDSRPTEALAFLQAGMSRFPTYEPFFTNALTSARGAGRPDLVRDLEKKGKTVEQSDPFFLFAKGLSFFQDAHFDLAASELSRAHEAKPDSPAILAWLARAYLSADRREPGVAAFHQLQATAPKGTHLVSDLQQQFPYLGPARAD
ncbi:MAG: tetratricopeptide repeat protein [Byssovorax sp.]